MISNKNLNNQYSIVEDSIDNVIGVFREINNNSSSKNQYALLEEVDSNLQKIFKVLKENEEIYLSELESFLQIETYITYIVGNNCEIENFGHFDCVYCLLNIFKELFDTKINYLKNNKAQKKYDSIYMEYKEKLDDFREFFNENIFFAEKEFDSASENLNIMLRA